MVKIYFCLLFLCGVLAIQVQAEPLIEASIDSTNSQAHFPLTGIITITHSNQELIDAHSFKMENKPLNVSFVKNVKITAAENSLVTIYSFQLPAKNKGLYELPKISVKIKGKIYESIASSYEVNDESTSSLNKGFPSNSSTVFQLKAKVEGPSILYPGERTKLFYQILYNRSIDLTESQLPMIHPAHFKKIGDVQIKDYQKGEVTVQYLTQEIEASETGVFQLGPSFIEGYAYSMQKGQKIYNSTLLRSEAPIVTLEIKSFPALNQPPSFLGAIGQIKATAHLASASKVLIGDNVELKVEVQGVQNLAELKFPYLQCQPGFSGFFQTSDLPPAAEVKNETKIFNIELRPLNTLITHIPSIELSSFDSVSGKYIVQQTSPIPLTVESLEKTELNVFNHFNFFRLAKVNQVSDPISKKLEPLDSIKKINLNSYFKMTLNKLGSLIILSLGLLFLQKKMIQWWNQRSKLSISESEKYFKRALKEISIHPKESLQFLEKAFWLKLVEKEMISPGNFHLDIFPKESNFSSIHSFILQLQALQYSKEKNFNIVKLRQTAEQLFKNLSSI